jgi:hypothetical protein
MGILTYCSSVNYRLCGLVVRVLGYRCGDPGSIPGTTIRKKLWVWNGVHSASWVQLRSYLIKICDSCLENREYGRRDPSRWPRGTLYPLKLAITSPTSGCRSVGIVRSRTQTMEFSLVFSSVNRYEYYWRHSCPQKMKARSSRTFGIVCCIVSTERCASSCYVGNNP